MKLIEIQVHCLSKGNTVPEGLEDIIKPDLEWRKGFIIVDKIMGAYDDPDDGLVIVLENGSEWTVKEDIETIKKRIDETKD